MLMEISAGVGDLDLVLQGDELAEELLLLRAPPAAEEVHERRVATDELLQRSSVAGVVEQFEVGEGPAGQEVGSHERQSRRA